MSAFAYADSRVPVRSDLRDAQRQVWERISRPSSAWTGAERVHVASLVREARAVRADPPWLRGELPLDEALPGAAVDVARRVAIDAHRLDRAWAQERIGQLGLEAYVEVVAITACVSAIDAFAEALGVAVVALPEPMAGAPTGETAAALGDAGAWFPMTVPWKGPNVGRALSPAPGDYAMFMQLVGAMYAVEDFFELVWDRPLSRPQVEVTAARVSAVNECFY
jgi:hypothetical protein